MFGQPMKLSRWVVGAALIAASFPAFAQLAPLAPGLNARPAQPAPPPLHPDPRDFSGYWKAQIPLAPGGGYAGAAFVSPSQVARRECIPEFAPFSSVEGAPQFVQTPKLLLIVFEEGHRIRFIRINGAHPANLAPSYWGDSVAHWDGDTLVVETTGMKGQLEPGGPKVSPLTVVTERLRKIDGGAVLEDRMSYAGPPGEKLPPPLTIDMKWSAPQEIMEWICEDNGEVYWTKK